MLRKLTTLTNKCAFRLPKSQFASKTAAAFDGASNTEVDNPLIEKILKKSLNGRALAQNVTKSTNLD